MGRSILITGGSRGIGAATARLAASHGWDVALSYSSRAEDAEAVAADVRTRGRQAFVQRCEVSDEADVVALFEAAAERLGPPSAVVVNAGVLDLRTRVEQMGVERLRRMFDVNLIGAFLTCREAVRAMSTRFGGSGGSIVLIGSAASRLGSANEFVDYAASKGGVDSLTIGLANEVAADAVRVNCVRPGLIYTDIHADAGAPDRVDELMGNVPMRRGGHADEVAEAILWLASDRSSYVTGTFVDVTGGR
ncbi:MAG: SDR family oxidoreductase [Acidimicrobiia bacterium]|nr:SDR family oxidoreductase [Acidimicrobiia bacterium]